MNSGSMAGSFCVSYQGVEKEVNSEGAKLKKQFICIPDKMIWDVSQKPCDLAHSLRSESSC